MLTFLYCGEIVKNSIKRSKYFPQKVLIEILYNLDPSPE